MPVHVHCQPRFGKVLYNTKFVNRLVSSKRRGAITQRLFVYGSLAPGGFNHHILAGIEGDWVAASVRGHLREAGWGAAMGYPAIVLDDTADPVSGFVFVSDQLREHWPELDTFEGEEYERVRTSARLEDGTSVAAFVYVLRG
jgi:gamma-glutamylcyclotransferase (GGCT)/AIG2-like uncharacterized protein YtfP